jgi:glycosyltransferase involved in cell wall biosynthesis
VQVAILSTVVPTVRGGGRFIVDWTAEALTARGHDVEVLSVPFDDNPEHLVEQIVGLRRLPVADAGEVMVTVRWPAHMAVHPRKIAWFIHHQRVFFDLWDTPHRPFPDRPYWRAMRELLRTADTTGLAECRQIFANSAVVASRLERFNRLDAEVLLPPLPERRVRGAVGAYGDAVVFPSRVTPGKRQLLAVQALALTTTDVRLVIAGRPESQAYADQIRSYVEQHDLGDRVELMLEWVPQERMDAILSTARAVLYAPVDEDSYGYPSLEAAAHARPILTTTDSGGVLEFVQHERSGIVVEPEAAALAVAFDRLRRDDDLAAALGAACRERTAELHIGWDHVVGRLLAASS